MLARWAGRATVTVSDQCSLLYSANDSGLNISIIIIVIVTYHMHSIEVRCAMLFSYNWGREHVKGCGGGTVGGCV